MPCKSGQRICRRNRIIYGRWVPHRSTQIVRVLPCAEMFQAQAQGQNQVLPYSPTVFAVETHIPVVKIGTRQDILLIETLKLTFHEVCQIVSAGNEWWSERGRTVRIRTRVRVKSGAGGRKVVQTNVPIGCAIGDGLVVRYALEEYATFDCVMAPNFRDVISHTRLEFL